MIRVAYHFASDVWERRKQRATERRTQARTAMLRSIMLEPVSEMIRTSPTDTNRFRNANVQAAQEAGIGPLPARIMPLQTSKYYDIIQAAAQRQIDGWERVSKQAEKQIAILDNLKRKYGGDAVVLKVQATDPGTIDDRIRRQEKRWLKAQKNIQRAKEEAAKVGPTSIAIGAFAPRRGRAIGTQIIDRVYGGSATVRSGEDVTVIELRNKEAHARILETRLGWAKKAKSGIRKSGGKVRGRKYAELMGLA